METKVVVMPLPTKRRVRIRLGGAVYELSVNVAVTSVALPAPAPLHVMPNRLNHSFAGALLDAARIEFGSQNFLIADPFSGGGTVAFEAARRGLPI